MPLAPIPPYNITQPRVLQRWLDVNSQNGPLQRCQTYLIIPAFSFPVTWNGYSDIVGAFNFHAPNAFSITCVNTNLKKANYVLAISYVNYDRTVVRYVLNKYIGEVIYFDTIPYVSQPIKRNFRFEVWSTNVSSVTQDSSIKLYTSVMQNVDTRYGVDMPLSSVFNIDTNFSAPIDIDTSPIPFTLIFPNTININSQYGRSFTE